MPRSEAAARVVSERATRPPISLRLGDCHIWWARTGQPGLAYGASLLDESERARCESFQFAADRQRFTTGCAVLRLAASSYLGIPPAEVTVSRQCPTCGRAHGRPTLPVPGADDIDISVSHSGDRVAVAFGRGRRIGIDVEKIQPRPGAAGVARVAFTDTERQHLMAGTPQGPTEAFLRVWTRKEAITKALGLGLRADLQSFEVSAPHAVPAVTLWPDNWMTPGRPALHDLPAAPGYVASIAILGGPARIQMTSDLGAPQRTFM